MGKKDKEADKQEKKKKKKRKKGVTNSGDSATSVTSSTASASSRSRKEKASIDTAELPVPELEPDPVVGSGDVPSQTRPSSFKAMNSTIDQTVSPNYPIKMLFSTKQFDLAGEFNLETSTFIPTTNGVYLVLAHLLFNPFDPNGDYRTRIEIRVNGNKKAAMENDFFGGDSTNMAAVSAILHLEAGDQVEIYAESNISGTFFASENDTRFEAARFPS